MLLSIFAVQMLVKLRNKGHNFSTDMSNTLRVLPAMYPAACPLWQAAKDTGKDISFRSYPVVGNAVDVSVLLGITPKDADTIIAAADNPTSPDGITLRSILCPGEITPSFQVALQIPTSGYADRHNGLEMV